jgi:hypothetical protein
MESGSISPLSTLADSEGVLDVDGEGKGGGITTYPPPTNALRDDFPTSTEDRREPCSATGELMGLAGQKMAHPPDWYGPIVVTL